MSLKGSLQTVALPEVLEFLSSTGKSGEFHVSGSHGEGRLWFEGGRISGFEAGASADPADAIFQLLRIGDGDFSFAAGEERPAERGHAAEGGGEVAPAIEAAQARLVEWSEIVAVVPSLAHRVRLLADAPNESVILERAQWALVVTIAGGRSVGEVIADRALGEFDGCKAIRDLVDASLAEVFEPEASDAVSDAVEPEVVGHEVAEPEVVEPEAEEPAGYKVSFDAEPQAEPGAFVDPTAADETVAYDKPVVEEEYGAYGDAAESGDSSISGSLLRFGVQSDDAPANEVEDAGADSEPAYDWASHSEERVDEVSFSRFPVLSDPAAVEAVTADALASALSGASASADDDEDDVDHYAALRAAMVEVGENLNVDVDAPAEDAAADTAFEIDSDEEADGRAALHALLTEVTSEEGEVADDATHAEPVDGLADRGPWTEHELATMDSQGAWQAEEQYEPSNVIPFSAHYAETADAEADSQFEAAAEDQPAEPAEEPINRGLLLKFLSSVRN